MRWLLKAERTHDETCIALASHSLATALTANLDTLLDGAEGDDPGSFGHRARRGRAARARRALRLAFQKTPRRRRGRRCQQCGLGPRGWRTRTRTSSVDCHPIRFALENRRRHDPVRRRLPGPRRRARQGRRTSRRVQQEGPLGGGPRRKGGAASSPRGPLGLSQRAGSAPPGALVHGASRTGRAPISSSLAPLVAPASGGNGRGRRARRGGGRGECGTVLARHADE